MAGRKGTGSGAGEGAGRKVALQTQIWLPFCLTLSRDVARSCYCCCCFCCCCCCFCYCQPWQIARDTGYRIIKRNKSTFVRAVQTRMTTKPMTGTGHKTQRALICRQEHHEDIEPIQVFLHVGEFTQLPKCPVELITVGTAAAAAAVKGASRARLLHMPAILWASSLIADRTLMPDWGPSRFVVARFD